MTTTNLDNATNVVEEMTRTERANDVGLYYDKIHGIIFTEEMGVIPKGLYDRFFLLTAVPADKKHLLDVYVDTQDGINTLVDIRRDYLRNEYENYVAHSASYIEQLDERVSKLFREPVIDLLSKDSMEEIESLITRWVKVHLHDHPEKPDAVSYLKYAFKVLRDAMEKPEVSPYVYLSDYIWLWMANLSMSGFYVNESLDSLIVQLPYVNEDINALEHVVINISEETGRIRPAGVANLEKKESIAEAVERLTDGVEVILDEETPDEELPKQDATENIEELAEDVKEASEEELVEKYDLMPEEVKDLKQELAEIKEEISETKEEESEAEEETMEDEEMSTAGLSEQELIIHNTPVEELTSADVRRVALAHARNKTLFKTAAMFAISEEKCQAILDRFFKKFASEEERDQKALEMRKAGASNAQIKEECCIISDPVLYSIYKKYGVPKKPRSRKEVDLTDPTSELVIDAYNSGVTVVYQIRKTTGVSEYLIKKILSAANDAGVIHLPESPEDVE